MSFIFIILKKNFASARNLQSRGSQSPKPSIYYQYVVYYLENKKIESYKIYIFISRINIFVILQLSC